MGGPSPRGEEAEQRDGSAPATRAPPENHAPFQTLILTAEDGLGDTLRPRLDACARAWPTASGRPGQGLETRSANASLPSTRQGPGSRQEPTAGKPPQGPLAGLRSLRVGDLRIIYRHDAAQLLILVLDIARRDKAYRRPESSAAAEDHHQQQGVPTFGGLAATYLEVRARPRMTLRTYQEEDRILRADLVPAWRHRPVTEIRRRDVAQLLDGIIARGSPVQANRTRSVAHRVFAFAVEREIVEFNPVVGLRRPSEERSRERVLTEDEIFALWRAWETEGSVTSALFRMLLITAQRKHEVTTMRWIDVPGAWWTIWTHRLDFDPSNAQTLTHLGRIAFRLKCLQVIG